jgi:hypothetical protein
MYLSDGSSISSGQSEVKSDVVKWWNTFIRSIEWLIFCDARPSSSSRLRSLEGLSTVSHLLVTGSSVNTFLEARMNLDSPDLERKDEDV